MTEHDTDIEFDFFEEEPATEETSESERTVRRPGPRGPRRPPRAPANLTPLLRLVGLIAFAILIIVLLVFWIQSCRESGKQATYRNYMAKVSEVASSSQQIGHQLSQALLATGLKQSAVQQKVSSLARQEQLDVERARGITPPGRLRNEHQALIEALQFRVSGLTGFANALGATAGTKDLNKAASLLASQMQRLLASDVVYDDQFKDPAQTELRRQGVTGTGAGGGPLVPDSNFLPTAELATTTAIVPVLQKIRGSTTSTSTGGLHGTNIVSTKVLPSGTELNTTHNLVTVTTDMAFQVTVKDSGDSQETGIPVTLTIVQAGAPTITKKATISFINAGEEKQVNFGNIPLPKFGPQATIKVVVQPVPNESTTDNNSADYPVIFTT
jgi:hypothetical protein